MLSMGCKWTKSKHVEFTPVTPAPLIIKLSWYLSKLMDQYWRAIFNLDFELARQIETIIIAHLNVDAPFCGRQHEAAKLMEIILDRNILATHTVTRDTSGSYSIRSI